MRTRAFNHAGPGQSDTYVIGSLTRQVAEAEAAGESAVELRTGNPDSARDFTDVRDVAAAYTMAIDLEPGVYNVASERAVSVRELVDVLGAETQLDVRHEVDPDRVRSHDVREVRGSAAAAARGNRMAATDRARADDRGRAGSLARYYSRADDVSSLRRAG